MNPSGSRILVSNHRSCGSGTGKGKAVHNHDGTRSLSIGMHASSLALYCCCCCGRAIAFHHEYIPPIQFQVYTAQLPLAELALISLWPCRGLILAWSSTFHSSRVALSPSNSGPHDATQKSARVHRGNFDQNVLYHCARWWPIQLPAVHSQTQCAPNYLLRERSRWLNCLVPHLQHIHEQSIGAQSDADRTRISNQMDSTCSRRR